MAEEGLTQEQIAKRARLAEMMKAHVGVQDMQKPTQPSTPDPVQQDVNDLLLRNGVVREKPYELFPEEKKEPIMEQKPVETPAPEQAEIEAPVETPEPKIGPALEEAVKKTRGRRKKDEQPSVPETKPADDTCDCCKPSASFMGNSILDAATSLAEKILIHKSVTGRAKKLAEIGSMLMYIEDNWDSVSLIGHGMSTTTSLGLPDEYFTAFTLQAGIDNIIADLDEQAAMLYKVVDSSVEEEVKKATAEEKKNEPAGN